MPSSDRDTSRDSDCRLLTHRPSMSSDHGARALVPMWDSSDPERAPPPLPLNPQSPVTSRPNTSSAIQAHHAALTEKAREIAYIANLSSPERKRNDSSPDKALVKSAAHKRMQSLQTGHVRDLSNFIDSSSNVPISPEKSQTRPTTPRTQKDFFQDKSPDKERVRAESPTPPSRGGSDSLHIRPSLRRQNPNILGENSPQSATMVALQSMSSVQSDNALTNTTNGSNTMARTPQTFDAISTQILSLTSIATSLQREMAALSRRSKDNATDLVSLKEATNSRDEDIRKSLRELVTNINENTSRASSMAPGSPYLLDNKPHSPSPRSVKTISLPRIPSPRSFNSFERETTPVFHGSGDGSASIALLEKILRDMGTKEGQDLLISRLTNVAEQLSKEGIATARRLEDLVQHIRENTKESRALVRLSNGSEGGYNKSKIHDNIQFSQAPRLELDFDGSRSGPMVSMHDNTNRADCTGLSEDILKIIRSTKDSVAQGGGLTAEVKALVRELRGEVLGMGRELGRKLEETQLKEPTIDPIEGHERMARVVQDGLAELKQHLDRTTKDSQRKSLDFIAAQSPVLDGQEVYNAVKAALIDHKKAQPKDITLGKDEVVEAVKSAWENYRPDIELQHFGLERDELLACLQEGFEQYVPQQLALESSGATRDEVFSAVVEGLKHFVPPQTTPLESLSREEVLDAVRECLEEFEFPAAPIPAPMVSEVTRIDVFEAVQEGLSTFQFPDHAMALTRGIDEVLSRDDVFEAVQAGLTEHPNLVKDTTSLAEQLQDILDTLRAEFQAISTETAQYSATHTHDTEQVLEAHRDGMERLRYDLESYIDRTNNPETKEPLLASIRESFGMLQAEIMAAMARGSDSSVEAIKEELDDIRESLSSSMVPSTSNPSADKDEIIHAFREGLDRLHAQIDQPKDGGEVVLSCTSEILTSLHGTREEIVNTFRDSLSELRASLERSKDSEALILSESGDSPEVLSALHASREEIISTLQDGLEELRQSVVQPTDKLYSILSETGEILHSLSGTREDLANTLRIGLGELRTELDRSKDSEAVILTGSDNSTELLDVLHAARQDIITILREGFDEVRETQDQNKESGESTLSGTGDVLDALHGNQQVMMSAIQEGLDRLTNTMVPSLSTDTEEIINALKEGLDALRADIIDQPKDSGESILSGTGEILDALHDGLDNVRAEVEKLSNRPVEPLDQTLNYEILDTLKQGLEGLRADIDRLRDSQDESKAVAEIGSGAIIAADGTPETEALKRDDIENLEVLITRLHIKVEALESMPPPIPQPIPASFSKEDLEPVHEAIRNVQASVTDSATRAQTADAESVRREDIEAIETLLRNTKAKIDEMDPEQAVKKEHFDVVELIMREAHESITELLGQMDETARKEELSAVEALVINVASSLDELKEHVMAEPDDSEKVTKTDVEAVEAVCHDIKSQIEQLILPEFASLASKEDVSFLGEMVKELKTRIETHAESNAKAFEERQAETVGVGELVGEVKSFLEEFKEAVQDKLDQGATGVAAIDTVLAILQEKLDDNASVSRDLTDVLNAEFEKSNAGVVGIKLESDEHFQKISTTFEEKFDELMQKLDETQTAADAKALLAEEARAGSDGAMLATKTAAEDIKLMIDVFGTSLTETTEKMEEASKTVFTRVEDTFTRVEETHADAKAEHQLTREQVFMAINAVEGIQGTIAANHPAIIESIKEVLLAVGRQCEESKATLQDFKSQHEQTSVQFAQHFESSRAATDTLQAALEARPSSSHSDVQKLIEGIPAVEKYDDSHVHEKLDKIDSEVHEKLNKLVEEKYDDASVHEKLDRLAEGKYDDSHVHEKLDKLVEQMQDAAKSFTQLEMLDNIRERVINTASEVSAFVAAQTMRNTEEHEDRERAAEAAAIALEKRTAEKEAVETDIERLHDEEDALRESVLRLKADHANLSHRKLKLSADVSSLETALRIRREELHTMESRAEGLERRILEGVIDHNRAFLLNKNNNSSKSMRKDLMNLKRVPSQAVNTRGSLVGDNSSRKNATSKKAMDMAMSRNRAPPAVNKNFPTNPSRRILSLNQITNNVQHGGFGRSQSVKTKGIEQPMRKSSWAGTPAGGRKSLGYGELNKENLALQENEHENGEASEGEASDAGTMRRGSQGAETFTGVSESDYTESEYTESTITGTDWTGTQLGDDDEDSAVGDENGHVVLYDA